jgi:hypothetical protein
MRTGRTRGVAGGLLLLFAAGGCAVAPAAPRDDGAPVGWLERRRRDLVAIFDGDLSFGPGLGARVAVTRHVQAGFMLVGPTRDSRVLPVRTLSFGKRGEALGIWSVEDVEYGLSPWYVGEGTLRRVDRPLPPVHGDFSAERGTALSVGVHLGLVGAEFSFDPIALVRFISGLFGDAGAGAPEEPEIPPPPPPEPLPH